MITDKEITAFWKDYYAYLSNERDLVPISFLFLWVAIILRRSIRKKYYSGNKSALNTNLWYILKDDLKNSKRNGGNDYSYLDYGEESFKKRYKLLGIIALELKNSLYSSYIWMLRNNVWNYKETYSIDEQGIYNEVIFVKSSLTKNGISLKKVYKWAEIMYTDKADNILANRGSKFNYENSIIGEQEVYYRTINNIVHGRYSRVYTWIILPFGYQILREIQKGTGGLRFRYRNKFKLIKFSEKI